MGVVAKPSRRAPARWTRADERSVDAARERRIDRGDARGVAGRVVPFECAFDRSGARGRDASTTTTTTTIVGGGSGGARARPSIDSRASRRASRAVRWNGRRAMASDRDGYSTWCRYGGKFLSAAEARALDDDLIAGVGCEASTLEALMRRAGEQAASATLERARDAETFAVLCGPGNNGGDGLVLARACAVRREGARVVVWYPKGPGKSELYAKLVEECRATRNVRFADEAEIVDLLREASGDRADTSTCCFIDALFGFSFRGAVREPYVNVMKLLTALTSESRIRDVGVVRTVSLDIPSGWSVDGAPNTDDVFIPDLLISLTAPKRCCATFYNPALGEAPARLRRMAQTHVVAGTFLTDELCERYGLYAIPLRRGSEIDFAPLDLSRRDES